MAGEDPVVSPGLSDIAHPKHTKDAHRRFKLSLGEWTESSEDEKENDPPAPLKRLKLSLKKLDERWYFLTEVAESDLQQKYVAKNTFKATKWAHSNFTQWKMSRNSRFASEPDKQVPEKVLECAYDPGVVSKWLALYIAETRKENGDCYPPKKKSMFSSCSEEQCDETINGKECSTNEICRLQCHYLPRDSICTHTK